MTDKVKSTLEQLDKDISYFKNMDFNILASKFENCKEVILSLLNQDNS